MTVKYYHNGDTVGYMWNWYNPLTYIISPIFILGFIIRTFFMCGIYGFDKMFMSDVGLRIDPYFKKHPEKLAWIKK